MTTIGLTGHQVMPAVAFAYAENELRRLIAEQRDLQQDLQHDHQQDHRQDHRQDPRQDLLGVSCLAAGSDQLFARLLLEAGGVLHTVIPSHGYEQTFGPADLASYRRLSSAAAQTVVLDFDEPGETAFHAAGRHIVDRCDLLLAVWDGEPARGLGGSGDIVSYAHDVGRPVTVIWPRGVRRG